jgi:hypothetical protein
MGDESPPLPRGSYNFNFDDFDENTNPFETKTSIKVLDNDSSSDPFKPSKALSQSPTTSNNNIHDTVNHYYTTVNRYSMCKIFNTLKNISVIPSSQYMYQSETQKKTSDYFT